MALKSFINRLFKLPKADVNYYTHWDILALARIIAPGAWQALDEAFFNNPKTGKPYTYMDNLKAHGGAGLGTNDSFRIAVDLLMTGVSLKGNAHLWSDDDVYAYLEKVSNHGKIYA